MCKLLDFPTTAVILAGGLGTRIAEESQFKPKPMIEIGGKPILWHIMKHYSSFGVKRFVICLGYKGYLVKEYFTNYRLHNSDVSVDLLTGEVRFVEVFTEPWSVSLVDTGELTQTGGRLKRVSGHLRDEPFFMTYGDGVGNVDLSSLWTNHVKSGKLVSMTVVQPPGRFGTVQLNLDGSIEKFIEKPDGDGGWINGGFFVINPSAFEYLHDDSTIFEQGPLQELAQNGELNAYKHLGFWQPMDTMRDHGKLQELWVSGSAPWRTWS